MGEQQIQQEAGVQREAQSNKPADCVEPVGIAGEQELRVEEPLQWHKASAESPIVQQLDQILKIFGHTVKTYGKDMQKQLKTLKRF